MSTITAMVGGGLWSSPGTWSGGVVPTAADEVVLASTSGNVTVDANAVCRSLDCQASGNYAGTLAHAASVNLTIGDGTAGAGARIIRLSSGMTITWSGNAWSLVSTSATVQTITTAGKAINWLTLSGGASTNYRLADPLTVTVTIVHNIGTFDTNGQAVTCASFASSNSNTRTLTLGSSTITCTVGAGANAWDISNAANFTLNAGTSTIVLAPAGGSYSWMYTGGKAYYDVTVSVGALSGSCAINGGGSFRNLSVTFGAQQNIQLKHDTSITVTGTLTLTGNSPSVRGLVTSTVPGTAKTITAAAVSLTNVDFMDITGAGAATWSGSSLGDCGGNSGITPTASVTRYGVVAGNWSSTATWSATSGGAGGASVPLPQDDVILNASSGAGTYTVDMPRACKNLTATGFVRTLAPTVGWSVYGSFSTTVGLSFSASSPLTLAGRGSHTISLGNASLGFTALINAPGGTYTLADAWANTGASGLQLLAGTLVTNSYSIATTKIVLSTGTTTTLGASVVSLSDASAPWVAAGTLNAGTSTIVLTSTSAATKTFAGGNKTYYRLLIQGGATNAITVTGANTWDRIDVPAGCVLTFPASVAQTFTGAGIVTTGAPRAGVRFPGVNGNYASAPDAADLRLAGSFQLVARISASTWATAGVQAIVAKYGTSSYYNQRAYMLAAVIAATNADGRLALYMSSAGTLSDLLLVSDAAPPLGDLWVKVKRDGVSGVVTFYTHADQAAKPAWNAPGWVQLGSALGGAGYTASLFTGTAPVTIGAYDAGTAYAPILVRSVSIESGIDAAASAVLTADLTAKPFGADSFVCATGQTVSVNGDLAKAGDGRVLLNSATPGTAATITRTGGGVIAVSGATVKDINASGVYARLVGGSKNAGNSTGWFVENTDYAAMIA